MKNKKITMLELFKLIADNKPPKKIRWKYALLNIDKIYTWYDWAQGYYEENHGGKFKYKLLAYMNEQFSKILNSIVEILPEENEMKEMVYQKDEKIEVLYHDFYKGYEFYIMNLGAHPTAYVNVINNKLLAMKDYNDIDISVHGCLTFSEDSLYINNETRAVKGWFIGWDYAHYGDYVGYDVNLPIDVRKRLKKWTTEEIYEDVKSVIEQCINYKENDEWEDIGIIENIDNFTIGDLVELNAKTINQLIKNQKYLKEKLESKDEN